MFASCSWLFLIFTFGFTHFKLGFSTLCHQIPFDIFYRFDGLSTYAWREQSEKCVFAFYPIICIRTRSWDFIWKKLLEGIKKCVICSQHTVKFIYSEKATKICEIFSLLLSYAVPVKSKVKIAQNFVAFSEYMNFKVHSFLDQCTLHNLLRLGYMKVVF